MVFDGRMSCARPSGALANIDRVSSQRQVFDRASPWVERANQRFETDDILAVPLGSNILPLGIRILRVITSGRAANHTYKGMVVPAGSMPLTAILNNRCVVYCVASKSGTVSGLLVSREL